MKVNEIARAFGMSVDQFAKRIGYTRQALYEGIRMTTRSKAAISTLRDLNSLMHKMEQEEVQRRFDAREKALKEFEQQIIQEGEA